MAVSVLIVDDDDGFARAAAELLQSRGYRVVGRAATVEEARAFALRLEPESILLDVRLPDGSGVALASEIRARLPRMNLVLVSTDPDAVASRELDECGAAAFLAKTDLAEADLDRYLRSSAKDGACED
jgi:DNA-binding NarL/FixJ family response regulator